MKQKYEEMVAELKLNIEIHPAVPDIMEKYKESSMLLMSSLYEPFGLVLVEAMSCGLPVVAFNCPYGPAAIITDGTDGFLVDDRNINAFDTHLVFNAERESIINIAYAGYNNIYLTTSQGNNIINYYMTRDRTSTHINK